MAESDPLLALRQAVQNKSSITFAQNSEPCSSLSSATHIVISGHAFPKATSTRFLTGSGASSSSSSRDTYSLAALYLAWTHKNSPGAEYMKQAREGGLLTGFVSVTERKGVVDWLEGTVGDHGRIQPIGYVSTTPPGTPPRSAHQRTLPGATPAKPSASLTSSAATPAKRKYVADPHDAEIVKKIKLQEVELRDKDSVLRGNKTNNFSSVRQAFADKLKKMRDASRTGAAPAAPTSVQDPKMQARKAKQSYPIIMISSSPTALITMHNVKRFLQESVFEPSLEAQARARAEGNSRPEDMIPIYRKLTHIDSSGKETAVQSRYVVVDSTEALSKFGGADAWDRVVCVMTTGQAWQFRPYKWSEPKVLFHHVKGVYMSWTSEPPNPKIRDWNVTELKIDQHRRHVDKSVVAHFWRILDEWTLANKPWLVKS
ncbi:accessory factor associated with RNA polymerase II [Marasmius tenuissimus]|uniref:Accessory factor associated with RNA polymerase II n=1 Tax=Marasmius tenuissimus TaxID=585030 RepID=A0ABR2ZX32_9AGAR|nr:accessory factor associated with RNA polymerase II [Marasmius tenuissimus]